MAVRIPMVVKRGGATPSAGWVRPADWLAIPEIAAGEEVVYILQSVLDVVGNFAAVKFGGDYTVDWGDGNIENFASGVKAEHSYNWADVGDVTSEGFRQALIKVTPQAGQNITSVDLQEYHSVIGDDASSQFIDLVMNIPNVSGTNLVIGGATIYHRLIERVWIKEIGAVTSMNRMFNGCYSLQSVPLFDTSSVEDMRYMFAACISLQTVPLFDTSSVEDMRNMFYYCYSLQTVPLFDTSSVEDMDYMFYNCYSLQTVPLFDTSSVEDMKYMFYNCYSLQTVPLFDTSSVEDMDYMFLGCYSLQSVPLFDTLALTRMKQTFRDCKSLQSVPLFDTSSVTYMANMFDNCYSLQRNQMTGTKVSFDMSDSIMSAAAIDELGGNVADLTGETSRTVNLTGNYGVADADLTIWTDKNWTVVS